MDETLRVSIAEGCRMFPQFYCPIANTMGLPLVAGMKFQSVAENPVLQ